MVDFTLKIRKLNLQNSHQYLYGLSKSNYHEQDAGHGFVLGRREIPNFTTNMKVILLLLTVFFTTMAVTSCTNDEGEDLEVLTPDEEKKRLQKEA